MSQQTVGVNSCLGPAQLPLGEDRVHSCILKCIKDLGTVQHMERDCSCLMEHTSSEARNAQRPRAVKLVIINKHLHFVEFTTSLSRRHLFAPNAASASQGESDNLLRMGLEKSCSLNMRLYY